MADPNTALNAMYIISKVESNHKWDSVNFNDPITIGIMQWFGTRAASLLGIFQPRWGELLPSLRNDLETYAATSSFWTRRYLEADEANALRNIIADEDGRERQTELWFSDYDDYYGALSKYGFSESQPQQLIMLMSAYHQTPSRGLRIARDYGGSSSLLRIYNAILADPVFGAKYKGRYNDVYNYLNGWNGTDPPPEFGGINGPYVPPDGGTDPTPPPDPTPPDRPGDDLGISSIQLVGDHLHVTMRDGRRAVVYQQSIQNWSGVSGSRIVPPAPEIPPPDTPEPPTPDPTPGVWAHPCPARTRVSSEFRGPGRPNHNGIDLAAPMGTPLYAVDNGVVLRAGPATGFGGYIGIRLDSGEAVGYGHMKTSSALVSTGDRVTKGQQISAVASEGQSSGPHLHFEVYSGGVLFSGYVNPRTVLESKGVTP